MKKHFFCYENNTLKIHEIIMEESYSYFFCKNVGIKSCIAYEQALLPRESFLAC